MQSQFSFHADRPLQRSLLRVAEALSPKLAATEKAFRTRITRLQLSRDQQRLVSDITPGAAVKAVREGSSPSEFFRRASASSRMLALLNTRADQVVRALAEYEKAASPVYESLPVAHATDAHRAKDHLHCALIIALNQSFAAVQEAEIAVRYEVLGAELQAINADVLLDAFLKAIQRHFSASAGAVYVHRATADDRGYECAAALDGRTGEAFTITREAVRRLRKLRSGTASLAIAHHWSETVEGVWSIPVGSAILQIGFNEKRPMLPREAELLSLLAERCSVALVRIAREARTQQMSVRMLEVEELERRRISRELHDDAAQALAVIRLQLEMTEFAAPDESTDLRGRLSEMRELTERTIRSVRSLMSDLSPAVLEQLGLPAAVRQLAKRFEADRKVSLKLDMGKLRRMHPRLEVVIYRVLQECFRNIAQHSQAVHVNVTLKCSDRVLKLAVHDDGIGFNVDEAMRRRNCYGLIGIRERVTLFGGIFRVVSTRSGSEPDASTGGTRVLVQLPLAENYPG